MPDLIKEIITGVVENVVKELLKKSHGRTTTKRKKRQTRSASTGRFVKKTSRAARPARKQVSRRRTAASRSRQRSR
ncbi:hypothetical protein [Neorhizobium alkalisoli]|uniref:hypothetical protein n=1 Tax=Neorhizobium alkalisoli TaxID=528178 RepID=UPI000CF98C63|nr:hypothetical protein [Neorhizobium alkalisoli]